MAISEFGLDGSHFQTLSDAAKLRAHGEQFASWKFTEGTTFVDSTANSATQRLRAAGFKVGGYHFAQPGNAKAQAQFFKSRAAAVLGKGSFWPMLDMEASGLQLSVAMAHMQANLEFYELDNVSTLEGAARRVGHAMFSTEGIVQTYARSWPRMDEGGRRAVREYAVQAPFFQGVIPDIEKYAAVAAANLQSANQFIVDFYDALDVGCMIVYGNLGWWQTVFRPSDWTTRNIVGAIARYNGDPGNPGFTYPKMAMHQYDDARTAPGISTFDGDVLFNGYTLSDLLIGAGPAPAEETQVELTDKLNANPAVGTVNEALNSVLFGLTGQRSAGALALAVHNVAAGQATMAAALTAVAQKVDADFALDTGQTATLATLLTTTAAAHTVDLSPEDDAAIAGDTAKLVMELLPAGWNIVVTPAPRTEA